MGKKGERDGRYKDERLRGKVIQDISGASSQEIINLSDAVVSCAG